MGYELEEPLLSALRAVGRDPQSSGLQTLRGDGSKRVFFRIKGDRPSLIIMINPPVDEPTRRENRAYVEIGRHLHKKGIPVPELYACDLDQGWVVLEDLGETTLQEVILSGADPLPTYEKVISHLIHLQTRGADGFDPSWCCQTPRYDLHVTRHYEATYFCEAFLGLYLGLYREWSELDESLDWIAHKALDTDVSFFLHRDFQSRNLMVSGDRIGIVDWQGGRLGPLGYDLASLLIDPYTRLSPDHRSYLYEHYIHCLEICDPDGVPSLERTYPYLAIQRNLQILGAFSFLTLKMHKAYFEAYIPRALETLREMLEELKEPEVSPLRDLVAGIEIPQAHGQSPASRL